MNRPAVALLLGLLSVALTGPGGDRGSRRISFDSEKEPEATYAQGALQWRLMTLRGPDGRIPRDGLGRARAHMQRMRARAQRLNPAQQLDSAHSLDAAQPLAARAQIARDGWRWLGPGNIGGRVRSLVIHPTNPNTMFTGSVAGGIWRSDDGAGSWRPVDDFMGNLVVSSIVINPRNPDIMYAGTGEVYNNYDALHGGGIFKSLDGGVTWNQLPATATDSAFFLGTGRLAISPDGKVLIAAAGGFFFRSTDAGATFTKSAQLVPIDVDFHPTDSTKAVAVGYSGAGFYTRDGGATWLKSSGVPTTAPPGRLEVTYARSEPNLVYLTTLDGAIYVSTDGGVSYVQRFAGFRFSQGWYNLVLWVNPRDANHLILGAEELYESVDGGFTWRFISESGIHTDHHLIVEHPGFDNASNRTVFFGNDGGIYRSDDVRAGQTYRWTPMNGNLGITQFYGAAGNPTSGRIIGGTQDNGTLTYQPENGTLWNRLLGGDGGFCAADQTDPNVFYGEFQYLQLYRSQDGGSSATWIGSGLSDAGTSNANFIAPFVLDPNDQRRMLAGGRSLWRTNDAKAASPSWNNIKSGANESNISAIAVAQGNPDIVWVGHSGGNVYKTTNGTAASPTWTLMYSTVGNTFVTRITIDPTNPGVVYVGTGGFSKDALVRSDDGGATWTNATGTSDTSLPVVPVRDLDVDPFDFFTIYAATEVGLFVSHDRGSTWELPQDGPANVSVDEMFLMGSTLVAATHGRGLFALDLAAQGRAAVVVTPDRIDFGAQAIGVDTARKHVTVTNSGTAAMMVQSVQTVSGDLADFIVDNAEMCAGAALAPGDTCGFDVRFRASDNGQRDGVVQVTSTAPGSPHQVSVSGFGGTAPASTLPAPWLSRDIGDVGVSGRASFANGTFTLEGAGADIWGSSDAFQFAYQPLDGDGEITARVATIENTAPWTKMGVMIRASLTPSSAYGFMLVSSGKGLAFQRRTADGVLATNTAAATGTAPRWVRLQRAGNLITAFISGDGVTWTTAGQDTIALGATAYVGLVAHSHDTSQLATATFDSVGVASASTLPPGWHNTDVGNVGVSGRAGFATGTFTLEGAGADIWGTSDAFQFAYRPLTGDGEITARVATIENTAAWTKMGVMIRASLAPSSAYGFMLVSSGKGLAFQRRATDGALATNTTGGAGTAPRWVRIKRAGGVITAFASSDGVSWTAVGQDTIALAATAYVGLVAHSHDTSQLATATFDNVTVGSAAMLPSGWSNSDVGNVGVSGRASFANGVFTLEGAGADIWASSDAFQFAYRTLNGDGTITARVATIENTAAWTKMGVMVRASLTDSSAYGFMLVSSGKGLAFQRRTADGALAAHTSGGAGTAPKWVRLKRAAGVITASISNDGVSWTTVGQDTIALPATAYVGLVAHSHDPTKLATATFDNVSITGAAATTSTAAQPANSPR